jgi:hypothetical protein
MEKFYCQIIYKNADAYPNLKVLYEAALVCPSTSVDCERGFLSKQITEICWK